MKILQTQIRRFWNSTILPSPILARVFKNRFFACVCVCWTTTHLQATTFCVCVCVTGHVLPTIVADFLTYGWKHRILNFRNGLWKHRKQKRRRKTIGNILRLIKTIKFDVFTFKNFWAWKRQKRVQIFEILHFQKRQIWQFNSVNFMKILQKRIRRF